MVAARERFELGAVHRSLLPGEPSGDTLAVLDDDCSLTLVIVDGVGHGPLAHAAAGAALRSIEGTLASDRRASLCDVIRECDRALRGTPGAAVGICRFEPARSAVSYLGVGNTTFLRHPSRNGIGVSLPGIVGFRMRSLRTFDTDLVPGDLYALHTDGVSRSFEPSAYATLPVSIAARRALEDHGKITDDAALVMARFRS